MMMQAEKVAGDLREAHEAIAGTNSAVPALAALLSDPHLSAYARSGLEGIPDPSAAAAFREAATKIQGPLLAGVVNSLGMLRDAVAVELLGRLASDPDSGVASEALLALGNISSAESIRIVQQALAHRDHSGGPARRSARGGLRLWLGRGTGGQRDGSRCGGERAQVRQERGGQPRAGLSDHRLAALHLAGGDQ